jgi:sugar lactone lactonase YvrE
MDCETIHGKQGVCHSVRFLCVSLRFVAFLLLAWPSGLAAQSAHFSAAVDFGTVAIGQPSAPVTLTATFDSGGTIGSAVALTQGAPNLDFAVTSAGSCTAGQNYPAGGVCTVVATFTPRFAGERSGAVVLQDASGNAIATGFLHGVGSGPQAGFRVLTAPLVSFSKLGILTDKGIAVDGLGDIFVSSVNSKTGKESVVEAPAGCNQASCVKQLPGTFYAVWGLAVDGAGNLWVGDEGANGTISEIPAAGEYAAVKTYSGSFGSQIGVAADGSGNIVFTSLRPGYADSVMELKAAGGYTTVETLATNLNGPGGVAVDGNGDVFYVDSWIAGVQEIVAVNGSIPASPAINTLAAGLKGPEYLAVEGSGNLLVTANAGLIYEVPADGGYSAFTTFSNQLTDPTGIAVDAGGNLYASDIESSNAGLGIAASGNVYEIPRAPVPSLTFATPTAPGVTDTADGAQKVSLQNLGNQPLVLTGMASSTGNFTLDTSSTTCTATTTLAGGDSCTLGVLFTPTATGNPITGTLVLTDNSLYGVAVQQSLALVGTGLYTPTIEATANSWLVALSQDLTMTITIHGGSGNPTPSGTVQASATGYSGSPVTLSNGQAMLTIPAGSLSLGQPRITIQYQPDTASASVYIPVQGQAVATVTGTLMNRPEVDVLPAAQSISVGQALSVTVNVDQAMGAPVPTGAVTLTAGHYTSSAVALSNGSALFTIPANSLIIGADELVATYAPDSASANIYVGANGASFVFVSAAAPPAGAAPVDFGSLGIGVAGAVTPVTLNFTAGGTPASLIATTQGATGQDFALAGGGSCSTGVYVAAGTGCTVNLTFTPRFPGVRNGAVAAMDENGQTLAMTYIHGVGNGAQISILADPYFYWDSALQLNYPFSTDQLGDGFTRPMVAVDGNGNVFVADFGNGAVSEIPAGCASADCVLPVMSGLLAPTAVAVDGAGNLFVAEAAAGDVKEIPPGCHSLSCTATVGVGFNQPYGVSVGSDGDVFVADTNNDAIKEVVAASGYTTINTLAGGLDLPWSVVVNATGDLFVAEGGDQCQAWIPGTCSTINTAIVQIPAAGGYKTVNTLGAGDYGKPLGLAIDGSGNVYEADYGDSCVSEFTAGSAYAESRRLCTQMFSLYAEGLAVDTGDNFYLGDVIRGTVFRMNYAGLPSLNFKTAVAAGTSDVQDGAQVLTLQNNGNSPLILSGMVFSDPSFQFDSKSNSCSTATPVPAGGFCYLAVDFVPVTAGPHSATLTLTDNQLNQSAATQNISITASALPSAPVILTTPANPTTATTAAFTFSDPQSPVTFVCSIDALPYAACASPMNYTELSGGAHAFQVKAKDTLGHLSQAAVYAWTENSLGPPAPVLTSTPAPVSTTTAAAFAFSDAQSGVSFLCSLDGAAFAACTSGVSYTVTGNAGYLVMNYHSFAVEAQDGSGNVSPETTFTWTYAPTPANGFGTAVNFEAIPVGQTSAPRTITFFIANSATVAAIDATTMGATGLDFAVSDPGGCAVGTTVTQGGTYTLQVTFAPKYAGQRKGAVVLLGAAGSFVGVAYLEGVGMAPQVTFTPYTTVMYNVLPPQNNADSGKNLGAPVSDVTVDGAGNVYVSDLMIGSEDQSVLVSLGDLWEYPLGCTSPSCIKLLATTVPGDAPSAVFIPTGIAMDGAGLIWIANEDGLWPTEFPTVGSIYSPECWYPTMQTYWDRKPAVDGAGVASYIGDGILELCASQLGVAATSSVAANEKVAAKAGRQSQPEATGGGGITGVSFDFSSTANGLTVDPQGNLFIADAGNNAVKEVQASSNYTISRAVGSGFNNPTGVAADAFGNIFVSDTGNNALKMMTAASGYTQILTLATPDPKAIGLANLTVDAAGNVYLANTANQLTNQLVKLDFSDAPALNFVTATRIGTTDTTDGTLTATVKNGGNAPLIIGGLAFSNVNFQIDAAATTCTASAPLAAGASCNIGVIFTPATTGTLSGTLTLTDNALNAAAATQLFPLSGTAYATPTTSTPAVAVAPTSGSITTAQTNLVTVTVSGANGGPVPTGSVALFGGNYSSTATPLSGGSASFTIPAGILALGSNTLNAVYTPDAASSNTYGTGAGSASITVSAVAKSTPAVSVTPAMMDVSTMQSLPVSITVSGGGGNPTPTGSVALSGGNYGSLAAALSDGSASITIPAGYLPAGAVTLTAYYTPDLAGAANYNSASGKGQVAVEAEPLITPLVTVTPASGSIITTQSLPVTVQVQGGSGDQLPTGSVVLSSGSYSSAAAPISNGSVVVSIPAGTLAAGSNTLTANYLPDNASALLYNSASGANTVSAGSPPPAPTIVSGPANPTTAATAAFTFTDAQAGVTFQCSLDGAAYAPCSSGISYASIAAGAHSFAVEAVDSSSNLSAATTYNWTVNAAAIAAPGDFALSVRGSGQTLAAGGEAQYTVTVSTTPAGDVCNNPVTLSVKGLPPGATAGFSPAAVTPGAGSATSTLTVQMAATSAKLRPDGGGWALALPMLAVILLAPTRRGQKRKSHNAFMILFCLLILGAVCATVGCGGGFAVTPSSSSYTLTITGTNGSVNHSTTVTLAVK